MKHRMIWIFLAGMLAGLILSGSYKHFVTDRIMDGGNGMENPDTAFLLDGDHTYVDNSNLWPVLEGTWKGENGRWQAVIGEESGIVLRADGETVLTSRCISLTSGRTRRIGQSLNRRSASLRRRTVFLSVKSRILVTKRGAARAAERWC